VLAPLGASLIQPGIVRGVFFGCGQDKGAKNGGSPAGMC